MIDVTELQRRPVIGRLGLPLGTVAEYEANVIAGDDLRLKQYASAYLLRVTRVNGRPLATPVVIDFSVPGYADVDLANDVLSLLELRSGKVAGRLDSARIEDLEHGYVGKSVPVAAYETGRYSGIPSHLPDDVPVWADVGFGFSTSLVVLAER